MTTIRQEIRQQPRSAGRKRTFLIGLSVNTGRLVSVVVSAAVLGGCVVGPDYKTPSLNMPGKWSNTSDTNPFKAPQLSRWWQRLGDTVLNDLIEGAVGSNLDVATAKAKIREARASYRQSIGKLAPSFDGSASATRSKIAKSTGGSGEAYNQFEAGFDASWELSLFGANRRATEVALYSVDAAEDDLRYTLPTLIGDVASNYVEARGYQARAALARTTAASQRKTATLTRRQFEAGSASAMDVAKADAEASNTEANIPTYESLYAEEVHRLGVLTGKAPSALAERMKRPAALPQPRLPIPTGIPANILLNRPDVRSAERRLAQHTAKIGEAEAARYPDFSLTGNLSTTGVRIGDLAKNSTIGWSFGPSLSIQIFNGGQLSAAVEVAEAQRDQYFIAHRLSVLTALEDVENGIVSLGQERIRRQRLTSSARSYREALRMAQTLYQTGTSSFLDVLDAQRSLYSAEDSLIEADVSMANDYIFLNKALGGGWGGIVDSSQPEIIDSKTGPHFVKDP